MPEWEIEHRDHDYNLLGRFKPANELVINRNKNAPSSATYDLARSDPMLTQDCFAPYRTDCYIYRDDELIISGPHTSRSWDNENEGVISVGMLDWMHLTEKLYYPVPITGGTTIDVDIRKGSYYDWMPHDSDIPIVANPYAHIFPEPGALDDIVKAICTERNAIDDIQWNVYVMNNGGNIPTRIPYVLAALDGKSMYTYISELSQHDGGFDWDVLWQSHNNLRIRLWYPKREDLDPTVFFDNSSQFAKFKWTDEGPIAARTYGLGQGHGTVTRLADVSIYAPSEAVYRELEIQEDFGDLADSYQYSTFVDEEDRTIARKTGARGNINRGPKHTIECSFLTSVLGFNFWTQMGPGTKINIDFDFEFHRVNHDYLMLGYEATINSGGDELIKPDLQRVSPN